MDVDVDLGESSRDEAARLASLAACAILDTPREVAFDNIVYTVAQLFRAPIAVLTLVDDVRVWAKARVGQIGTEWLRSETFCGEVIGSPDVIVVEDATADPRFATLATVAGEPYIRFLIGAPLIGPGRQPIGALCAIDRLPRTVQERHKMQLRQLASQAGELLRLRVPDLDVSA